MEERQPVLTSGSLVRMHVYTATLLSTCSTCRGWSLVYGHQSSSHSCGLTVISFTQTLVQAVLDVVETESCQHSPNYGLLILWASLANAAPVSTRETTGLTSI